MEETPHLDGVRDAPVCLAAQLESLSPRQGVLPQRLVVEDVGILGPGEAGELVAHAVAEVGEARRRPGDTHLELPVVARARTGYERADRVPAADLARGGKVHLGRPGNGRNGPEEGKGGEEESESSCGGGCAVAVPRLRARRPRALPVSRPQSGGSLSLCSPGTLATRAFSSGSVGAALGALQRQRSHDPLSSLFSPLASLLDSPRRSGTNRLHSTPRAPPSITISAPEIRISRASGAGTAVGRATRTSWPPVRVRAIGLRRMPLQAFVRVRFRL